MKLKTKVVENSLAGVSALIDWLARQGLAPTAVHAVLETTVVAAEVNRPEFRGGWLV